MYFIAKCEQALGGFKEVMRALEWETADGNWAKFVLLNANALDTAVWHEQEQVFWNRGLWRVVLMIFQSFPAFCDYLVPSLLLVC